MRLGNADKHSYKFSVIINLYIVELVNGRVYSIDPRSALCNYGLPYVFRMACLGAFLLFYCKLTNRPLLRYTNFTTCYAVLVT
jgi:hypothetical protein